MRDLSCFWVRLIWFLEVLVSATRGANVLELPSFGLDLERELFENILVEFVLEFGLLLKHFLSKRLNIGLLAEGFIVRCLLAGFGTLGKFEGLIFERGGA